MKTLYTVFVCLLPLLLLGGCQSNTPKRDPEYAAVRPIAPPPAPQGNGAIYQAGYERTWFEDMRARNVGDLLTIQLAEKTEASKESNSEIKKSNSTSVTNPTVFGTTPEFNTPTLLPLASHIDNNLGFSLESSSAFKGEGDADQKNELTGDVTVTVVEVLPNGNLVVRGEKRIGINQGNEYVKISGIVRPADIDSSNTVLSTKVADATMIYVGDGQVADASVMGWFAKFFISALMPF